MFFKKRNLLVSPLLFIVCAVLFFICLVFEIIKESPVETSSNIIYKENTLSAIVFADSDTSEIMNNAKIDIQMDESLLEYLENVSNSTMVESTSMLIEEKEKELEIEREIERQRKLEEERKEQVLKEAGSPKKVKSRGLSFNYDPNLVYVDMTNLEERFHTFAPNDNFENTVIALSKMAFGEAGGCSDTEIAATIWSVLNRYDTGYADSIFKVVTAPGQYYGYSVNKPVYNDIYNLCKDVLARWVSEREGNTNVGRILPSGYNWFYGDGVHNHYRNSFRSSNSWDWSLPTPYAN